MKELRLGIVQLATEIGQVDRNFNILAEKVRALTKQSVDVVVLPETWNTGFMIGAIRTCEYLWWICGCQRRRLYLQ